MTTELEQRLREIEARHNNSTEGLWVARKVILMESYLILPSEDKGVPVAKDIPDGMNCTFMAHAHQDVPFLISALREALAEVARVEKDLREMEVDRDGLGEQSKAWFDAYDDARAELKRLRKIDE